MCAHRAIVHHHEDDEDGADGVEHEFDREDHHPGVVGGQRLIGSGQQAAEHNRQHQHRAVQQRDNDRRPARFHRTSAIGPQFTRRRHGICGNDGCADHGVKKHRTSAERQIGHRPDNRSRKQSGPIRCFAVKHARRGPDHAACGVADNVDPQQSRSAEPRGGQRPDPDRQCTDQVSRAPPSQRRYFFLAPEKQQQRPEHCRDQSRNKIQRRNIQRHMSPSPTLKWPSKYRWSCLGPILRTKIRRILFGKRFPGGRTFLKKSRRCARIWKQ